MKKQIIYILIILASFFILIIFFKNNEKDKEEEYEKRIKIKEDSILVYQKRYEEIELKIDSINLILLKKDSILKTQLGNIKILKEKYDKKIINIKNLSLDESIKFFSNWISKENSN